MSLTIDTAYTHGRVVGKMVNYGFGMPTRLVADGDVARWCGRLVAHYGGTKALVVLGGDKHTRDELVSATLGSLDRALLERVLFRCGLVGGDGGDELIDEAVALATDEGVDFVLAIGDADTAGFARELARRMAVLDAGEDGFVPYGCIVSEGKVPEAVGTGEVPFLPSSPPNCWRVSARPCASCSAVCAPRPNICHKGMGYFWLVKRLNCQNKPAPFWAVAVWRRIGNAR